MELHHGGNHYLHITEGGLLFTENRLAVAYLFSFMSCC